MPATILDCSVHRAFALGCALAGTAIAAGIVAGHSGSGGSGNVRIVPEPAEVAAVPQRSSADWLSDLRRDLAIRADQEPAWQDYAVAMTELETSRVELEHQRAAGEMRNIEAERARHAMVLANALTGLERHLSPDQQTKARLLTRILSETVICRELAVR